MAVELAAPSLGHPSFGGALATPETRAALRRDRNLGRIVCLVGVALIVVFSVVDSVTQAPANRLLAHGRLARGVVVGFLPSSRFHPARATVLYDGGGWHEETVWLDDESATYRREQRVPVYYDPEHPTHVTIAGNHNQGPVAWWALMLSIIGALCALACWVHMALRRRRWRRILAATPWQRYHRTGRGIRSGQIGVVDLTADDGATVRLRLLRTFRPMRPVLRGDETEVWVAGKMPGRVVVATPGPGVLYPGIALAKSLAR
jgi:hypothetical protein